MSRAAPRSMVVLQLFPLLLALSFGWANAETSCMNVPISVVGALPEESRITCSAAETAIQGLAHCGIAAHKPLQIRIQPMVHHPLGGQAFALFDIRQGRILLTRLAAMPALTARTPFAKLPLADLYRSLIVHEVVHGVLHQHAAGRAMDQVASEYLAHSLQIASLPPAVRDAFLDSMPTVARTNDLMFSDIMLSLNPYLFAALAYQHFAASSDQCQLIRSLLEGSAAFIASSRDLM